MPAPGLDAPALDLLALLAGLEDHRGRRGRRHRLGFVLAVLVAAFISPAYATLAGTAAWAAGAGSATLAALGGWRDPFTGQVAPPRKRRWAASRAPCPQATSKRSAPP